MGKGEPSVGAVAAPGPSVLVEASPFLAGATAVAIGVFTTAGVVQSANPGMLRLVGGAERSERALDHLVSPSLAELRRSGWAYEGLLQFRDQKAAYTVRGGVRPFGDGLLVVAEVDVVELERVTSEVSALNSEMATLQRRLSSEQRALRRTVDELRATQAQLAHAETMSALGSFAAGLAHELNNPLAFVTSNVRGLAAAYLRMLEGYGALEASGAAGEGAVVTRLSRLRAELDLDFLTDDAADMLKGTLDGLVRMQKIIDALRAFLRPGEPNVEAANLAQCLDGTLAIADPILRRGDVSVTVDLGPLPSVHCNAAELGQVLLNLIANAAQAVARRPSGQGRITIRGHGEPRRVVFEVEDNGTGMPPEVLGRIFEPFFTTKPVGEGTGLGLHLAYRIIVDRCGGTITAASTPGEGSRFTVTLPEEPRHGP